MQVGHLARVLLPKFLPCKLRSASTGNPVKSMVSFQVTPCCIYRAGLEESCNYDEWLSCGQGAHLLHARAEGKAQVISLELPPGFRNETGWGTWYSRRRLFISRQQTEADPFGRNCSPLESKGVYFGSSQWNGGLWCLWRGIFLSGKPGVSNADKWPVPCQDAEGGMGGLLRGHPHKGLLCF